MVNGRLLINSLVLIGLSCLLHSCCKEVCFDQDIRQLYFAGFTTLELEKIKVVKLVKNSTTEVSSTDISPAGLFQGNPIPIYVTDGLSPGFDYRVEIEKINKSYAITDFVTEEERCRCSTGSYKEITGVKVDGFENSPHRYGVTLNR